MKVVTSHYPKFVGSSSSPWGYQNLQMLKCHIYKMRENLHLTYTCLPVYFKSSLNYL
jgi:hypothetical protein